MPKARRRRARATPPRRRDLAEIADALHAIKQAELGIGRRLGDRRDHRPAGATAPATRRPQRPAATPAATSRRQHYDQRLAEVQPLIQPRAFSARQLNRSIATILRLEKLGILDIIRLTPNGAVYHRSRAGRSAGAGGAAVTDDHASAAGELADLPVASADTRKKAAAS